jgi:AbiV family abortive infection protein
MDEANKKRGYRNDLEFIEAGFRACWQNANDLIAGSKSLMQQRLHAPALSLAVLALEEVGKMCATDGLLFARPDDHKSKRFGKSQRDHDIKLIALHLIVLFIKNISRADPRHGKNRAYLQALTISFNQLTSQANTVLQLTQGEGFAGLNKWKQRGFYVGLDQNAFAAPRDAVDEKYSQAVYQFAWQVVTTLDFVLKDGNLERYFQRARSVRGKLTERDHKGFEDIGQLIADDLFGPADHSNGDKLN